MSAIRNATFGIILASCVGATTALAAEAGTLVVNGTCEQAYGGVYPSTYTQFTSNGHTIKWITEIQSTSFAGSAGTYLTSISPGIWRFTDDGVYVFFRPGNSATTGYTFSGNYTGGISVDVYGNNVVNISIVGCNTTLNGYNVFVGN